MNICLTDKHLLDLTYLSLFFFFFFVFFALTIAALDANVLRRGVVFRVECLEGNLYLPALSDKSSQLLLVLRFFKEGHSSCTVCQVFLCPIIIFFLIKVHLHNDLCNRKSVIFIQILYFIYTILFFYPLNPEAKTTMMRLIY